MGKTIEDYTDVGANIKVMTVKKATAKVAKILRHEFKISWAKSFKLGKKYAQDCYCDRLTPKGIAYHLIIYYEDLCQDIFITENLKFHYGVDGDDSWEEYDITCLATGEQYHIQEYL